MNTSKIHDYSKTYRKLFNEAAARIPEFGMLREPLINIKPVSDELLDKAGDLIGEQWHLIRKNLPGYIGDHCIQISSRIFAMLNHRGFTADIVIGTVHIHGKQAYNCTVESLTAEAKNSGSEESRMSMHAWVSLGDDTIIDGAIPSYLAAVHNAPPNLMNQLFITRAGDFSEDAGIQYHPMIVGSEYIGLTNPPDPLVMLEQLQRLQIGRG